MKVNFKKLGMLALVAAFGTAGNYIYKGNCLENASSSLFILANIERCNELPDQDAQETAGEALHLLNVAVAHEISSGKAIATLERLGNKQTVSKEDAGHEVASLDNPSSY